MTPDQEVRRHSGRDGLFQLLSWRAWLGLSGFSWASQPLLHIKNHVDGLHRAWRVCLSQMR